MINKERWNNRDEKILKGIIAGVLSISCMMLPVDVENTTLGMSKVRAAEDDGYQVVDFDASDSMEGAVVTKMVASICGDVIRMAK